MGLVVNLDHLLPLLERERKKGKKVVTTNGVFDVFHSGHVEGLEESKKFGDILVVGVNSDACVKRLKGENRPIVSEKDRLRVVASINVVNYAFIFDEDTPIQFLEKIKPNFHVKGSEYGNPKDLPEYRVVTKYGGQLKIMERPKTQEVSTSAMLRKVIERSRRGLNVAATRRYVVRNYIKNRLILSVVTSLGSLLINLNKPINHKNIKKILLIKAGGASLGDTIYSLPIIPLIRKKYPKVHITYYTRKQLIDLVKHNPNVDKISIYDKEDEILNPFLRQFVPLKLISKIKREKYDLVIHVDPNLRFYLLTYLAGIPNSVGFDMLKRGFLLTQKVPLPISLERDKHEALCYLDLVKKLDLDFKPTQELMKVYNTKEDDKYAEEFYKKNKIKKTDFIVGMQPGAMAAQRSWTINGYAQIIDLLIEQKKAKVVILGGDNDIPRIKEIEKLARNKPVVNTDANKLQLVGLMKWMKLFIGSDSGLSALAGSTDVPTIVTYGPGDPMKWNPHPFGDNRSISVRKELWCSPCHELGYADPKLKAAGKCIRGNPICMTSITVKDVYYAINEMIDRLNGNKII